MSLQQKFRGKFDKKSIGLSIKPDIKFRGKFDKENRRLSL